MKKLVLSVGNCVPDHRALCAMIQSHFDAEVVPAGNLAETIAALRAQPCNLVLVNRILDQDGSEGLEVIRHIKAAPDLRDTPVMMISNFPEQQQLARQAGAVQGFGKQRLHAPQTRAQLEALLG